MSAFEKEKLENVQESLLEVESMCDIPEPSKITEDTEGMHTPGQLEERLFFSLRDLDFEVSFEETATMWKKTHFYLMGSAEEAQAIEVYEKALEALADFTSHFIVKFKEMGEQLSLSKYRSASIEAEALIGFTTTCFWHMNAMTTRFNRVLSSKITTCPEVNTFTANVFQEASNANNFIQKSFKLLVPILQVGVAV